MTKRHRLFAALNAKQERDGCANNVLTFIHAAMDPVRFVNNRNWFNELRDQLNQALAFSGYQLGEDGKLNARTYAMFSLTLMTTTLVCLSFSNWETAVTLCGFGIAKSRRTTSGLLSSICCNSDLCRSGFGDHRNVF